MTPEYKNANAAAEMNTQASEDFARDVLKALSSEEKRLESKYFYNDKGSLIFQEIMHLPEYYLTRCEEEIFNIQKATIFSAFKKGVNHLDIAELGAGDGIKTKILLKYLTEQNFPFSYTAIDISTKALQALQASINKDLPHTQVQLIKDEYLQGLSRVGRQPNGRKVLLFLGSNIGNFSHTQSHEFLHNIRKTLYRGDQLMTGFDLKKSPEIILQAYNDSKGTTAAFNLNLLQRINDELGGNFNLTAFKHVPVYDAKKGEARSYLQSLRNQGVWIEKFGKSFALAENELIHTEISRKYDLKEIHDMAERTGFQILHDLLDSKKYFCDSIWSAS
jgi:L-histidine N-alpha-methyltransferase